MQDHPTPAEILTAVSAFLKTVTGPQIAPHTAFQLRVAANALELAQRDITLSPTEDAAEHARLTTLLGHDGGLLDLNTELARRIETGEADLTTPGLAEHLWATTLAKLAVDQPNYSGYRAALAEKANGGRAPPND
jgi:Domain of unknown function (DUF6285)